MNVNIWINLEDLELFKSLNKQNNLSPYKQAVDVYLTRESQSTISVSMDLDLFSNMVSSGVFLIKENI